jgi:hypothetical protein
MHWPTAGWLYNVSVWSAGRLETSRRPAMIGGDESERPKAATAAGQPRGAMETTA